MICFCALECNGKFGLSDVTVMVSKTVVDDDCVVPNFKRQEITNAGNATANVITISMTHSVNGSIRLFFSRVEKKTPNKKMPSQVLAFVIVICTFAVGSMAISVASLVQTMTPSIETANGFTASMNNNQLTIETTVEGITKGSNGALVKASAQDITSTLLTDLPNGLTGPVNATDTILTGMAKLSNQTGTTTTVEDKNGFGASVGPNLVLSTTVEGLLKGQSGALVPSQPQDITSQPLVGFLSAPGTVNANDTILTAFNKLSGNQSQAASVNELNGFGSAVGPDLTLRVIINGLLKANGTSLLQATAQDITSQLLTGYQSLSGPVTDTDSLLTALGKLNGNLELNTARVVEANGFDASQGPDLTLSITVEGLLKGQDGKLIEALPEDITSQPLTGFQNSNGSVDANDTILSALGKLNGNMEAIEIVTANGFQSSDGPPFTLSVTTEGILKGEDGKLVEALPQDITSQVLTGYVPSSGPISETDTILSAFGKLSGNLQPTSVVEANGFGSSVGPELTLSVTFEGLAKAVDGELLQASPQDVTLQILTGYIANAGTVSPSDNILSALGKLDGNIGAISIVTANGFNSSSGPQFTLSTTIEGILKGQEGQMVNALPQDITSQPLTGYVPSSGVISETDTILIALGKLEGNVELNTANVVEANGFAAAEGPDLTLGITINGIIKGEDGKMVSATPEDITSQPLTGYVSSNGVITAADTILTAFGKLNGNIEENTANVVEANGFAASSGPNLTLGLTVDGLLKGQDGKIMEASPEDVTSQVLTGYVSSTGVITSADTILTALGKLNGNMTTTTVAEANGFGASTGPELILSVLIDGLLKSDGTSLLQATPQDITSQLLTGYVSTTGTLSDTDTILTALGKLNGNIAAISIQTGNGFASSSGPPFTLSTTIEGLLKGVDGALSQALPQDITSQVLTGYVSSTGVISDADSILTALGKLNGNLEANTASVLPANGFAASSGPELTLATTIEGLLKGVDGALEHALPQDITSQVLTGYAPLSGTITSSDSILSALAKLDGNLQLVSVTEANGFGSSLGPELTLSTTIEGLLKGVDGALQQASPQDITSQALTGYASSPGTITDADTLLSALGKLNGNFELVSIVSGNGFGASAGPQMTLSTTIDGVLKGEAGALVNATPQDITSQPLTGYASSTGTLSDTDTILTALGKLNGNIEANTASVAAGNGFGASVGPELTLSTTIGGLLKGVSGALTQATAADITSQVLTGYVSTTGTLSDADTILSAFGKLNGNMIANIASVINANGFGASTGPALTLSTTVSGLMKGSSGALVAATPADVTSQILTGYVSTTGPLTASDSILSAIGKLNGNMVANTASVVAANGFGASSGPALTLSTTVNGLTKGSSGALVAATPADVTSQPLTGFASSTGDVTATDTILTAAGKLQGSKLSTAGGTMAGNLDMGTNQITNVNLLANTLRTTTPMIYMAFAAGPVTQNLTVTTETSLSAQTFTSIVEPVGSTFFLPGLGIIRYDGQGRWFSVTYNFSMLRGTNATFTAWVNTGLSTVKAPVYQSSQTSTTYRTYVVQRYVFLATGTFVTLGIQTSAIGNITFAEIQAMFEPLN